MESDHIDWKPFMDRLPTLLYTLAYFVLKLELWVMALFWYALMSRFFGLPQTATYLVGSFVLAYLPFLSYLPYQLFKDGRLARISHCDSFFYSPVWYPIYVTVGTWVIQVLFTPSVPFDTLWYWAVAISLSHQVMVAITTPRGIPFLTGIDSFYHLNLYGNLPRFMSSIEVKNFDENFIEDFERKYHMLPWSRTWREELEQRTSRTHLGVFIALSALVVFLALS